MDAGMDVRDLARIRTAARAVDLALLGLLTEAQGGSDKPPGTVVLAVTTAREFAQRCQVALTEAMKDLPGYREGAR